MPVVVDGGHGAAYACHCLNIRIQTGTTDISPPESVDDPTYTQVYVGENIEIEHPQLTLRSRKRVAPIPGTNRYSRYTTLRCLLCNIPVYRIFQVVPADVEGKDGPILPFEDYVEKEIMKSPNGWLEVSRDLLIGKDAIAQAASGTEYSPIFRLIIPALSPNQATPINPRPPSHEMSRPRSPSPERASYFSHLKPVLQLPPFTPSHPAFLHLAQLAEKESQGRRAAAENYVAEIIRQKTAEIEKGDSLTRQQIEAVWRKFRVGIKEVESAEAPRSTMRRSSRSRERRGTRSVSPSYGTPIAVRDFVPVSVPVRRTTRSPATRQSALSASLVTTFFHHPKAQQDASSETSGSPDSQSSKTLSTDSSTLVQQTQPAVDGVNVLQFRRNINDDINTQASYRYFRNLEEDMNRVKEQRETRRTETSLTDDQERTTATAPGNGDSQAVDDSTSSNPVNSRGTTSDTRPPRGRQGKGKRKVTFDVEPDVATLRKETETEQQGHVPQSQEPRGMIFAMEDLEGDMRDSEEPAPSLPLLEQAPIARPMRLGRPRPHSMPEELASLRPSSLPAPSHIRPIRSPPGVDSSSTSMMLSLPQHPNPLTRRPPRSNGTKALLSPAKDTSSQRGSWSADGRTWQAFSRGHTVSSTSIPEESENEAGEAVEPQGVVADSEQVALPNTRTESDEESESEPSGQHTYAGIPGSLPIQIHSRIRGRQPLSLASYQPQSGLAEQQQQEQRASEVISHVNGKHKPSSAAIRKAVYAERDRDRSMDPGTEDFRAIPEEEEDDDDDDDDDDDESSDDEQNHVRVEAYLATSRGRKRALKILQARNKLPDSGMWRSLAS